jgi:hypothetical protein
MAPCFGVEFPAQNRLDLSTVSGLKWRPAFWTGFTKDGPMFWDRIPRSKSSRLIYHFFLIYAACLAIQNLGPQASGPASVSLAWPGRPGSPTPPSRPGRLAGQPPSRLGGWLQLGTWVASCWLAVGLFGPPTGDACWTASWPGGAVAWPGPSRGGQLVAWPRMWVVGWLGGLRASWLAGLAGALCVWLACWLAGWLAGWWTGWFHVAAWPHGWLGRGQPHSGMEAPFLSHGKVLNRGGP